MICKDTTHEFLRLLGIQNAWWNWKHFSTQIEQCNLNKQEKNASLSEFVAASGKSLATSWWICDLSSSFSRIFWTFSRFQWSKDCFFQFSTFTPLTINIEPQKMKFWKILGYFSSRWFSGSFPAKVSGPKGRGGFAWPCRSEIISDCNSYVRSCNKLCPSPHLVTSCLLPKWKVGCSLVHCSEKRSTNQQKNESFSASLLGKSSKIYIYIYRIIYIYIYQKILLRRFDLEQQNVTSLQSPPFEKSANWQPDKPVTLQLQQLLDVPEVSSCQLHWAAASENLLVIHRDPRTKHWTKVQWKMVRWGVVRYLASSRYQMPDFKSRCPANKQRQPQTVSETHTASL